MPITTFWHPFEPPPNEVTWARGRLTDRTYLHATFILDLRNSQDYGQPARFIVKVFDESGEVVDKDAEPDLEWTEEVVMSTPAARKQIKIQVARESGQVREIQLHRVPASAEATKLEHLLTLGREDSARFIDLIKALDYIPLQGGDSTVRLDDQTIRDVFADPTAIQNLYGKDPDRFRALIEADPSAQDIVAVAHRREVVSQFRTLLQDPDYFEAMRSEWASEGKKELGEEQVWQVFLETNPWILGVSLGGQLLTSWSNDKLEQVVAGFSVGGPGKKTDALLRTSGAVRSLVFAEIKHHGTDLLAKSEYRSGCWPASTELVGGVTQIQQTVLLASRQLGDRIFDKAADGSNTGEATYLLRPRSYLIVGHLDQLRGSEGVHDEKLQSFELFRRNLYEPEVITFDELLARAEWHVEVAAGVAVE